MLCQDHAPIADYEKYEDIIQNIRSYEPEFKKIVSQVEPHHTTAKSEVTMGQNDVKKLTFQYKELNIKKIFLEKLKNDDLDFDINEKKLKDGVLEEIDQQYSDTKRAIRDSKKEIEDFALEIGENYEPIMKRVEEMEALCKKAKELEKDIAEYKKLQPDDMQIGKQKFTIETAKPFLDNQIQEIISLRKNQQLIQEDIDALEQKLKETEEGNSVLLEKVQAETEKVNQAIESNNAKKKQKSAEMNKWYTKMLQYNRLCSGDSVQIANDNMTIHCSGKHPVNKKDFTYQICIEFDPRTTKMRNAMILPELINIQCIKERAIKHDDVAFLLREIKHNVQKHLIIDDEIECLKLEYNIEWNGSDRLTLILKNGEQCELMLEDSNPGTHYAVILLSSTSTMTKEMKQKLKEKFNSESLQTCIETIVEMLE